MRIKKSIPAAFKYFILILSILLVAIHFGCVSSGQMAVAPERRIPLFESTPHAGSWESNDVALEYQYVKQTDIIQLSVTGKAKRGYDQLNVWVLFVDTDGKVLERGSIYNSGFRSGSSKHRPHKGKIEVTFEMPLETTHIAFQSSWQPRLGR
jgi:hypothetical protein